MQSLYAAVRASITRQIALYRATNTIAKMTEILEDSGKNAALFRTHAVETLHALHSTSCEQLEAVIEIETDALYQRYVRMRMS